MNNPVKKNAAKRRPVNLTIREDILKEAKSLNLNTSKAAEVGIAEAIKQAQEQTWLQENRKALTAHNKRVEKQGLLLTPEWNKN
ncbi:MAG: type II toxin-antitoxin system CcdA family antitoxin [Hyphomicrobiales bacterium]